MILGTVTLACNMDIWDAKVGGLHDQDKYELYSENLFQNGKE